MTSNLHQRVGCTRFVFTPSFIGIAARTVACDTLRTFRGRVDVSWCRPSAIYIEKLSLFLDDCDLFERFVRSPPQCENVTHQSFQSVVLGDWRLSRQSLKLRREARPIHVRPKYLMRRTLTDKTIKRHLEKTDGTL